MNQRLFPFGIPPLLSLVSHPSCEIESSLAAKRDLSRFPLLSPRSRRSGTDGRRSPSRRCDFALRSASAVGMGEWLSVSMRDGDCAPPWVIARWQSVKRDRHRPPGDVPVPASGEMHPSSRRVTDFLPRGERTPLRNDPAPRGDDGGVGPAWSRPSRHGSRSHRHSLYTTNRQYTPHMSAAHTAHRAAHRAPRPPDTDRQV